MAHNTIVLLAKIIIFYQVNIFSINLKLQVVLIVIVSSVVTNWSS